MFRQTKIHKAYIRHQELSDLICIEGGRTKEAKDEILEFVCQSPLSEPLEQKVQNFIDTLNTPVDYQALLDRFNWSNAYFAELDDLLIVIGYRGQDRAIIKIKEFLRSKIASLGIMTFNKLFDVVIWNHFELIENHLKNSYRFFRPIPLPTYEGWTISTYDLIWHNLSENPAAIDLLEKYPARINYMQLSLNPGAYELLWPLLLCNNDMTMVGWKRDKPFLNWDRLSYNFGVIPLLELYLPYDYKHGTFCYVNKANFSCNPGAISLLKAHPDIIDWKELSKNPAAIDMLTENQDKIDWKEISCNPAASALLAANSNHPDIWWEFVAMYSNDPRLILDNIYKMDAWYISQNPISHLIFNSLRCPPDLQNHWPGISNYCNNTEFLWENLHNLHWNRLSANPAAIELIRYNPDKIDIVELCQNPYDYYREKITYFNSLHLFPRSHLEL